LADGDNVLETRRRAPLFDLAFRDETARGMCGNIHADCGRPVDAAPLRFEISQRLSLPTFALRLDTITAG